MQTSENPWYIYPVRSTKSSNSRIVSGKIDHDDYLFWLDWTTRHRLEEHPTLPHNFSQLIAYVLRQHRNQVEQGEKSHATR
ncbi:hypothetical protein PVA45_07675 (plasmid) [Entomospira entomophila]|uniref:Uncharacterized protein n=1 Tax=Entomospira entomophila TaxID=2719988 RepID=A0A968GA86_9SPIO|nr:hypothetical protein [Entomospira entomophilus]NIZ41382.1 hypothetical protein [Entomospira entomophilus]WDI36332.1 hypothetical protein PVA45_07675 [Entomospira entomophilus]